MNFQHRKRPSKLLRRLIGFMRFGLGFFLAFVFFVSIVWGGTHIAFSQTAGAVIPEARSHPLPDRLTQWTHPSEMQDHYLEAIRTTPWGYPLWSTWPVQIYVEPITESGPPDPEPDIIADPQTASTRRVQQWHSAVDQAIADWGEWLPLAVTTDPEQANIQILRSRPTLQWNRDGTFERARNATTRLEISIENRVHSSQTHSSEANYRVAQPAFTIQLGDQQGAAATLATARHELGHALGLWGHSPDVNDVMYAAQTSRTQTLSIRDLNTLKLLYQQPTALGWPLIDPD